MVEESREKARLLRMALSRREWLCGTAAIGFGASIGGVGLVSAKNAFAAEGGKPARGGTLSFNMSNDPPNLDLISNTTSTVLNAVAPCYNGLVQFDPLNANKIIGDLAESWDMSPDGKSYTFKLIKGVKFHDGKPMTSADVKYTFDVTRNPPAGIVSARQAVLSVVESIETPDDFTVRFILKRPSPSLIANLCPNYFSVLPKHVLEKGPMKDVVVGTGPYLFRSYSRGNSIELVRNPNYHIKDRPYLDGIKIYIVPDQATVLSYFRSGQLNFFDSMEANLARQVEKDMKGKADIQAVPSTNAIGLHFNTKVKPWDDVRVRKAVALAVDREAAVAVNFQGEATLGGMTPPNGPWRLDDKALHAIQGFAPKLPPGANAEARKLLAEAGFPSGFSTRLVVRRDDRFGPWGVFLKDQLAKVGIDVKLDMQEPAVYSDSQKKKNYDLHGGNLSIALDDPDAAFGNQVVCDATGNLSQICDPSIDQLFARQSETLDAAERKKLANQLETKVLSEYLVYPVAYSFRFQATRSEVHDCRLHPQTNNNRRMQDVWISKV